MRAVYRRHIRSAWSWPSNTPDESRRDRSKPELTRKRRAGAKPVTAISDSRARQTTRDIGLERVDVRRLKTLLAFLDLELDRLPLFERTVAIHLDGGVVDEYVLPTILGDEPVTLFCVEPLNRSGRHFDDPPSHSMLHLTEREGPAAQRLSMPKIPALRARRNAWSYLTAERGETGSAKPTMDTGSFGGVLDPPTLCLKIGTDLIGAGEVAFGPRAVHLLDAFLHGGRDLVVLG